MSIALRRIRDRIRVKLRDMDAKNASYNLVEYDQAIAEAYLVLQGRLPAPELYTANAFTIAAGGDTFTLPATVAQYTGNDGGAEYGGQMRIQLNTTRRFLVKLTLEQLDAMRNGGPQTALSIPEYFALWEENDQDLQGRCYPGAQVAESCNLFRSMQADDMRDFIGAGTDDMDDVEILFSRQAAVGLVHYVSAELLMAMPASELERRRLNPAVAELWQRRAEEALYAEYARRHDVESTGRIERWAS